MSGRVVSGSTSARGMVGWVEGTLFPPRPVGERHPACRTHAAAALAGSRRKRLVLIYPFFDGGANVRSRTVRGCHPHAHAMDGGVRRALCAQTHPPARTTAAAPPGKHLQRRTKTRETYRARRQGWKACGRGARRAGVVGSGLDGNPHVAAAAHPLLGISRRLHQRTTRAGACCWLGRHGCCECQQHAEAG